MTEQPTKTKRNAIKNKTQRSGFGWFALLCLFGLVVLVSANVFGMGAAAALRVFGSSRPHVELDSKASAEPQMRLARTVKVVASAYSSRAFQTDGSPCTTADGSDVCRNYIENQVVDTVAANGYRFGTVVKFPKLFPHLTFKVRDRMNARYGTRNVDIWLPTRADAVAFGRRVLDMEVYEVQP